MILESEEPEELTIASFPDSKSFNISSQSPHFVLGMTPLSVYSLYLFNRSTVSCVLNAAAVLSAFNTSMPSSKRILKNSSGIKRYAPVLL